MGLVAQSRHFAPCPPKCEMIRCRSGQKLRNLSRGSAMPVTGCKEPLRCRNHAAALLGAMTGALLTLPGYTPASFAATPDPDQQRWLGQHEAGLVTDGQVHFFPLPHERSGPTTVVVAADGRIWFTEGSGNRIGSMNPDGRDLMEFPLPHP